MPSMSILGLVTWIITLVAQPILAAVLFRSGRARRWPSFFAYLVFYSTRSVVLAVLYRLNNSAAYFYTYWVSAAVGMIIHAWILSQVGTALAFPSSRIRRRARTAVLNVMLVAFAIGFYASLQVHGPFYTHITQVVVAFERANSLAWCLAFLFLALGADLIGLKWMPEVLCLGLGFAINALGNVSWAWVVSLMGLPSVPYMDDARGIMYLVSLVAWSRIIYLPNTLEISEEFAARISSALEWKR